MFFNFSIVISVCTFMVSYIQGSYKVIKIDQTDYTIFILILYFLNIS